MDERLRRLARLHPRSIDLSLDRIQALLAALDHPEHALGAVVHVAGTNGKGTVTALIAAALRSAGRRTCAYLSPHLVEFRERIMVDGRPVGAEPLETALDAAEAAAQIHPATFFEVTTAAAFLAFREWGPDMTVLETGLGGRLDATNVVPRPLLTVITPIGLDHHDHLGPTLGAIAGEKAGILKPGVPCVTGLQQAEAMRVLESRAHDVGAPLFRRGKEWELAQGEGFPIYRDSTSERIVPTPLTGPHQDDNAGLAVAALSSFPPPGIPDSSISAGFARVRLPGRLQRIRHGALLEACGKNAELWIDAGHNPDAARALAAWASEGPPLRLVVGIRDSKDMPPFVRAFGGIASRLSAVPLPGGTSHVAPERIAEEARQARIPARAFPSLEEACRNEGEEAGRILVCGSFLLAGQALLFSPPSESSIQW